MSDKMLVSLRLNSVNIEKVDMLAISEDRSRNQIMEKILSETIKRLEKKHGEIKVDTDKLEKFRRKRRRSAADKQP